VAIVNKIILVTGGTSGIGLELVKKLSPHNQLIVISRNGRLTDELLHENQAIELYHADIGDKVALESVIDRILRNHTKLDILINNAAIQNTPEFMANDFNYDGIESEVNINFTAICHLTYSVLPLLNAVENGVIVNVNSGLAIAPKQGSAIYCATKSALNSLSISLRYQLQKTSIKVKQVFLPLVETGMTDGRGSKKLKADKVAEEIIAGIYSNRHTYDIGRVKLLRLVNYLAPCIAAQIMRKG